MNTSRSLNQTGSHAAALFRPDGWNRSIRIGAVVPHADVGPEAELQAMATDDITIHGSRLYFSAMRAGGEMDEKIPHNPVALFAQPPFVDEAVESLAASPLDALALAFTSSAYKHGPAGPRSGHWPNWKPDGWQLSTHRGSTPLWMDWGRLILRRLAFVSSIMPPVGCRAVRSTSRRKACTTGSSR